MFNYVVCSAGSAAAQHDSTHRTALSTVLYLVIPAELLVCYMKGCCWSVVGAGPALRARTQDPFVQQCSSHAAAENDVGWLAASMK